MLMKAQKIKKKENNNKKAKGVPPQKFPMPPNDIPLEPPVEFKNNSIYLCDIWLLSYNNIIYNRNVKIIIENYNDN